MAGGKSAKHASTASPNQNNPFSFFTYISINIRRFGKEVSGNRLKNPDFSPNLRFAILYTLELGITYENRPRSSYISLNGL